MIFDRNRKYYNKTYGVYHIDEIVGQGRYGVCFSAHTNEGRPVIIKRFRPAIFKRNRDKNAYEAVILSKLNHPDIPSFLGVINERGLYAFVLEYKPGMTVEMLLFKKKHRFSDSEIFSIGFSLLGILKYLHDKGVVHRDIRNPNVILNGKSVILVDFGLARWANGGKYRFDEDFSHFGDFLLYLLYSSHNTTQHKKKCPWYLELSLDEEKMIFIKRLLKIEPSYNDIHDVENDFLKYFGQTDRSFLV